ncbi:MAG: hypothetical protein L0241_08830 [Planctomycetia bacterium]|nr:hypothetical protein [Planctomycetia bacterium]
MSKTKQPARVRVKVGGPDYIGLLAEKLAELALMRVSELTALKPPQGKPHPLFDLVVTTDRGVCFFVEVKSYSSFQLKIEPESIPVLELEVDADQIRTARESATPVVMFLFDGDRGHGRFLRLDRLPEPEADAKTVLLSFPIENTITAESIRVLAAEIAKERLVSASA